MPWSFTVTGSTKGTSVSPAMGIKFARIAPRDQEFLRLYIHDEIAQQ